MWIEPADLAMSHVCPDGGRSDSFAVASRIVLGPGECGKDDGTVRP